MAIVFEQFRDPELDTSGEVAAFYPREFYALDNFAAFQVDYRDRRWATSEHAYQAAHFFDTAPELVETIAEARSPHDAQKIAQANAHRAPANWDEIKVGIMEEICTLKLTQNPYVEKKLRATGDAPIVEDSPKDAFWGWGPDRQGRNELGKVWMRIRSNLGQVATANS